MRCPRAPEVHSKKLKVDNCTVIEWEGTLPVSWWLMLPDGTVTTTLPYCLQSIPVCCCTVNCLVPVILGTSTESKSGKSKNPGLTRAKGGLFHFRGTFLGFRGTFLGFWGTFLGFCCIYMCVCMYAKCCCIQERQIAVTDRSVS